MRIHTQKINCKCIIYKYVFINIDSNSTMLPCNMWSMYARELLRGMYHNINYHIRIIGVSASIREKVALQLLWLHHRCSDQTRWFFHSEHLLQSKNLQVHSVYLFTSIILYIVRSFTSEFTVIIVLYLWVNVSRVLKPCNFPRPVSTPDILTFNLGTL